MTDYRADFPDWFGGFDPSYPSWEDLYNDADAPDGTGALIAVEMDKMERDLPERRRSGIDWLGHVEAIQSVIDQCRVIYLREYRDWLGRNAPMGSRWRPHERLARNHHGQPDAPDYGGLAGRGWDRVPSWPAQFEEEHAKPLSATGGRRRKDGIVQYGLGNFTDRPVGIKPMRPVYHLLNRFWREHLADAGPKFRPELPFANDAKVQGIYDAGSARAVEIKRNEMNLSARFLCLCLKEVDYHFNPRLCGLVAREYRHADTA